MRYDQQKYFVAPAKATPELWRTAAGVVLTFMAGLALYQLGFALVANLIGPDATQVLEERTTFDDNSAFTTLWHLFAFGLFGVGLAMVVSGLHRRPARTLFGPWEVVASDFLRTVLAVGGLFAGLTIFMPSDVEIVRNPTMGASHWVFLLPVSLAAILVQAGTEEAFFRGYLQQQLAARVPQIPLWLVVPSLVFGLAHLSPEVAGPNAPFYALWAVGFGLAAADLTARTGSLGAALGFHVGNNFASVLLTSLQGAGSGLALYHLPMQLDDPRISTMMLPEFAALFCAWLVARLALKV